jgi:hypothetical protein
MAEEQVDKRRPDKADEERRRRLALAMRENLRRRKAQARAREEPAGEEAGAVERL